MDSFYFQIVITLGLTSLFLITRIIAGKIIRRHASKNQFESNRVSYTRKLINMILALLLISFIGIVWEISIKGLSLYFASFFTVAGIGLFAQWSILSNITSSVILFFYFPFRIGSRVKIVDGENSITGVVKDITIFSIKIETDKKDEVSYPNNLAIQKPIIQIM
ncbi:MAG: mechanosensitive ion channel [Bacteroidetes bacterium]|nr:mechanosensitive ion channel [Bacteroidota bacterium]